jgi:hypothetical protein
MAANIFDRRGYLCNRVYNCKETEVKKKMGKKWEKYRNWKSKRRLKRSVRRLANAKRKRRAVEKWHYW